MNIFQYWVAMATLKFMHHPFIGLSLLIGTGVLIGLAVQ